MELIQYVRDKNNNPVGAVVAVGKLQVGWSRKHKSDRWNREKALMIARNRAVVGSSVEVPRDVEPIMDNMFERSKRYFQ